MIGVDTKLYSINTQQILKLILWTVSEDGQRPMADIILANICRYTYKYCVKIQLIGVDTKFYSIETQKILKLILWPVSANWHRPMADIILAYICSVRIQPDWDIPIDSRFLWQKIAYICSVKIQPDWGMHDFDVSASGDATHSRYRQSIV